MVSKHRITIDAPSDVYVNDDGYDDNATVVVNVDESPIIELEDLSVVLGEAPILDAISFCIPRGELVAIVGESGCGKTVLLKSIIGLIPPTTGRVWFDGQDLTTLDHDALANQRQRFGFVFQMAALFDSMTIGENIAFPLEQHTAKAEDEVLAIIEELLAEVGLPLAAMHKKPGELSGGMRKRVGFARALALQPEVMLFDEPTTGLDPVMSNIINDLMIATHRSHNLTGVLVTHDMASAMRVADRIMMLAPLARLHDEPQLVFSGTSEEFAACDEPRVREFLVASGIKLD
ncbi:MAG: ABC transporter ATP-binding protein [Thermoguttaceae bacterium]